MAPRYTMPDSESDSEPDSPVPKIPSDEKLERALRDAVATVYKSKKMEELTVKRMRLAAEKGLSLDEGFFKGHASWKARSDEIIKDEVEVQDRSPQEADKDTKEPPPPPAKTAKRTKPAAPAKSNKRRKTSPSESEEENEEGVVEGEESEEEVKKPVKKQSRPAPKKAQRQTSKAQVSDESDEGPEEEEEAAKPTKEETEPKDDSESDMSVLLDEEPKPTRKQKSTEGSAKKGKKPAPAKGKDVKAKDANLDPDLAEIKRLQGWLIKCGIRKMWARELAPYDTPKAKIKHLKELLKDAGMEGRYSLEKAKQIREERELKADLEMVQEGAKRWGTGGAEEQDEDSGDGDNKPRRRLARGRKSLAFLDSEGEETD